MKNYLIIVIIIAVVALMIWFRPEIAPSGSEEQTAEELTAINAELNRVDLGDLEAEFQPIDQEINAL